MFYYILAMILGVITGWLVGIIYNGRSFREFEKERKEFLRDKEGYIKKHYEER